MIDIKKLLTDNGIEESVATSCAEAIKQEIPKDFVSKQQYKKKTDEIDSLHGTITDLEVKVEKLETDEFKTKYETLENDFNAYKENIEKEKVNSTKIDLFKSSLKESGLNEKIIDLVSKTYDFDKIEIEEGKIKDWDNLKNPLIEEYKPFVAETVIEGAGSATPPANNNTNTDPFLQGFDMK